MQTLRRAVTRGCAALLCTAGIVAGPATALAAAPAEAADLSVTVVGTTFDNSVDWKVATLTVTNLGPGTATDIRLRLTGWLDGEVVDLGTVSFCPGPGRPPLPSPPVPTIPPGDRLNPIGEECELPDLPAGRSLKLDAKIVKWAPAAGRFGEYTATVRHASTDPVVANNTFKGELAGAGVAGPDLYARAWDVPTDTSGRAGAVVPGHRADLRFEIGNQGSSTADAVDVTVRLPDHVTFHGDQPGCRYDADRRVATCAYRGLSIVPADDDTSPDDREFSALRFRFAVRVAPDAPAPAHLQGGSVEVKLVTAPAARNVSGLPEGVTGARANQEVDPSDDSDRFTVFTAAADGDGGGLPVTGASAALIGGVGAGVIILGVGLFHVSRRRRLVTVGPDGEKLTH
ncbi:DUF11 domain-containing protein [Micromonospora sp. NBC_01699]|uniref:hypothetical protein n=1 Tax=Micromonospora sp. NBC_01699 TaxID=2975984 RepID=UPI002E364D6E|nr:hypothetical protein [Micromonospora sp. NBC_01699]